MKVSDWNGWVGEGLADPLRQYATQNPEKPVKWPILIATLLDEGYIIYLHKAKTTFSRYIYVFPKGTNRDKVIALNDGVKIRISNHPANPRMVEANDSDFYVGKNPVHGTWHTAEQAAAYVRWYYSEMNKNPKEVRLKCT